MSARNAKPTTGNAPLTRGGLSVRRMIVQVIAFAIGLALLAWCIHEAVKKGDWSKLRDAPFWLVIGLGGCSLVSLVANGVIFWLLGRTIKPLRVRDMVLLNMVTAVLNYAPIRAGMIARIAYNLKVDRMSMLQIGAWFGAVMATLLLAMGACVAATVVRSELDWVWGFLLLGMMALGGGLVAAMASHRLIVQHGRGLDVMLRKPSCLWGALTLRLVDIAAFVGRMACAVAILDLPLTLSEILLLAIATIALTLNPLGRVGFREAGVALVATLMAGSSLTADEAQAQMQVLALVESAGEAMVAIPLGAMSLLWYRWKWRTATTLGSTITRDE